MSVEQIEPPNRIHGMGIDDIGRLIYIVRGRQVMLDSDLAALYGVKTKNLNKAVGRNTQRFPIDFMFQLTVAESGLLRFQIGASKVGRGGRRFLPRAFTEHGVLMLSSVLNSERAVQVNMIERAQTATEREVGEQAVEMHEIYALIRGLMEPPTD
jgi:hypothetical protein